MNGQWDKQGAPKNMADDLRPGMYEIVHDNATVRSAAVTSSPVVAKLREGEMVKVVEVETVESEARVRGRLEEPVGWISLMDLQDGFRWARPQKSKLIENILENDAHIRQLLARTETLRMAKNARQEAYQARIGELQKKFLSAHILPVRSDPKPLQRLPEHNPVPLPPDAPSLFLERSTQAAMRKQEDPTAGRVPPEGRVVGYRFKPEGEEDDRGAAMHHLRAQSSMGEMHPPQPLSHERSVDYHIFGDQMLKPSRFHPVHPLVERGFMQNVHPITHPQTNMTEYDFLGRPDLLRHPNFNAALDRALAAPRYTQNWAAHYR